MMQVFGQGLTTEKRQVAIILQIEQAAVEDRGGGSDNQQLRPRAEDARRDNDQDKKERVEAVNPAGEVDDQDDKEQVPAELGIDKMPKAM